MNAGDLLLYLKGFELMQALREGQAKFRSVSAGIRGEVRSLSAAFGLGPSIITEIMQQLETVLA